MRLPEIFNLEAIQNESDGSSSYSAGSATFDFRPSFRFPAMFSHSKRKFGAITEYSRMARYFHHLQTENFSNGNRFIVLLSALWIKHVLTMGF